MATVSDFIIDRLHEWGVRRIYGYPGDGIRPDGTPAPSPSTPSPTRGAAASATHHAAAGRGPPQSVIKVMSTPAA
jgi:hypothetical protein